MLDFNIRLLFFMVKLKICNKIGNFILEYSFETLMRKQE